MEKTSFDQIKALKILHACSFGDLKSVNDDIQKFVNECPEVETLYPYEFIQLKKMALSLKCSIETIERMQKKCEGIEL